MLENIFWLGHSTIRIDGEKVIYIDPWKLRDPKEADIILISHSHYDHLSPEDVGKIQKNDTVIITTQDCATGLSGDVRIVKPGNTIRVGEVGIEAVSAYNIDKAFSPEGEQLAWFCGDCDGEEDILLW